MYLLMRIKQRGKYQFKNPMLAGPSRYQMTLKLYQLKRDFDQADQLLDTCNLEDERAVVANDEEERFEEFRNSASKVNDSNS